MNPTHHAIVIFYNTGTTETRWYRSTTAAKNAAFRILTRQPDVTDIDFHRYDKRAAQWLFAGRFDRPSAAKQKGA